MRNRRLIPIAILCALPFAANAQHRIAARVNAELSCAETERRLVGFISYKRDRGASQDALLATVANFPPEERAVAEYRIEDVFLDPTLTATTLSAYRMQRCLRGFERRNYRPFNATTREHLLRCQNGGASGSRAFARCIDDLLHTLEEKASEAAEEP
ncbi:MAG: hypothetical protein IT473_15215 [Lysobacter sp.]|nr:hypothetical protein [Lysobacter sp.]